MGIKTVFSVILSFGFWFFTVAAEPVEDVLPDEFPIEETEVMEVLEAPQNDYSEILGEIHSAVLEMSENQSLMNDEIILLREESNKFLTRIFVILVLFFVLSFAFRGWKQ